MVVPSGLPELRLAPRLYARRRQLKPQPADPRRGGARVAVGIPYGRRECESITWLTHALTVRGDQSDSRRTKSSTDSGQMWTLPKRTQPPRIAHITVEVQRRGCAIGDHSDQPREVVFVCEHDPWSQRRKSRSVDTERPNRR